MKTIEILKKNLVVGRTYRRSDLLPYSSSIDRHLKTLVSEGFLKKLSTGLYYIPKKTVFGDAVPEEEYLLKAFLKDDHFVVYSPSYFNGLGLGSTQLYNARMVFNRKRSGEIDVGGRIYTFRFWREAPKKMTLEFLIIVFLNELNTLAEDRYRLLKNLQIKLKDMDHGKLIRTAERFGTISTQKKLTKLLQDKPIIETLTL